MWKSYDSFSCVWHAWWTLDLMKKVFSASQPAKLRSEKAKKSDENNLELINRWRGWELKSRLAKWVFCRFFYQNCPISCFMAEWSPWLLITFRPAWPPWRQATRITTSSQPPSRAISGRLKTQLCLQNSKGADHQGVAWAPDGRGTVQGLVGGRLAGIWSTT